MMLEAGSETYVTLEGSPALHVAIAAGSLPHFADTAAECVALLVEKEADVFATDDYGKSALHLAAGHGLTKCVAHLLELYPTDGGEVGEDGEPMPDPIPTETGEIDGDVLVLLGTNQAGQSLESLNP